MGTYPKNTMRVSLACTALLVAAMIGAFTASSAEVADLGTDDLSSMEEMKTPLDKHEDHDLIDDVDDDDELGEGAGFGRGGFLMTQGSFTLMGGGTAGGGKEEELGEGAGFGRGGFLMTQGSFTLMGGGTAGCGKEEGW